MRKLFAILMFVALPAHAETLSDFAFAAPVEVSSQEALLWLELPSAVYEGVVRTDLGDLQVFNAAGEVVPHAFLPRSEDTKVLAPPLQVPLFPLHGAAAAGLEGVDVRVDRTGIKTVVTLRGQKAGTSDTVLLGYLADLSALERPLGALLPAFSAQAGDLVTKLRIEGSDDLSRWTLLADAAPMLRLASGGQTLERTRVELAPRKTKYLRLSWPGTTPTPKLDSLSVELAPLMPPPPRAWKSAKPIAAEKSGEYAFDLGGHFPVDRLRVILPEVNAVGAVQILSRAKPEHPWRSVTSGGVYRLLRDGTEVTSPDLAFATISARYWLVRVDARGGGLGSGSLGLDAGWLPQRMVFAARGAGPFQIAWGNRSARPTEYSVETLIPGYRHEVALDQLAVPIGTARLGVPRALAVDAATHERYDWKRAMMWVSLVLGVAVLARMVFVLARKMAQPKQP